MRITFNTHESQSGGWGGHSFSITYRMDRVVMIRAYYSTGNVVGNINVVLAYPSLQQELFVLPRLKALKT